MTLYHKVQAVQKLFGQLHKDITKFQGATGLGCVAGCGKCCLKPDIMASPLEFFPYAYHLYKLGKLEALYEDMLERRSDPVCVLLAPFATGGDAGHCAQYAHRGLICRLFGLSANPDKYGQARLVTCQTIKTTHAEAYQKASVDIQAGLRVPIMREYYQKLYAIDFVLAGKYMHINEAIMVAAETVLSYYAYRRRPGRRAS
jgi:Fe-S-cluster containining protein